MLAAVPAAAGTFLRMQILLTDAAFQIRPWHGSPVFPSRREPKGQGAESVALTEQTG
jgi:hypothetical protein